MKKNLDLLLVIGSIGALGGFIFFVYPKLLERKKRLDFERRKKELEENMIKIQTTNTADWEQPLFTFDKTGIMCVQPPCNF